MLWLNRHRRFRLWLSAYLDGELTAAEAEALERHLIACPACQREMESLRATVLALNDLPQEEIPHSFTLTPQQAGRPAASLRPALRAPVLSLGMRLASATLALALAVILVIDLGDLGGGASGPMGARDVPLKMVAPQEESGQAGGTGQAREGTPEPGAIMNAAPTPGPTAYPSIQEQGRSSKDLESPSATLGQSAPAAAEAQERAESGGGFDPLRAAEIALAAALGLVIVGSFTLALAGRKR